MKLKEYIKKRPRKKKIGDILFILFMLALIIPRTRMALMSRVSYLKAKVITPAVEPPEKVKSINADAFTWQLIDLSGNSVAFGDFKNKVIFLNFWATWCPPCVGELPEIQSLYNKFADNPNVAFLLVTQEKLSNIQHFLKEKEYKLPVFIAQSSTPTDFKTRSIPQTFIISKKGKIVVKQTGALHWNSKKITNLIQELIQEK